MARLFADHMAKATGQGFVVDNRQGADGIIEYPLNKVL